MQVEPYIKVFNSHEEAEEFSLMEDASMPYEERFKMVGGLIVRAYAMQGVDVSDKVEPIIKFRKVWEDDEDY